MWRLTAGCSQLSHRERNTRCGVEHRDHTFCSKPDGTVRYPVSATNPPTVVYAGQPSDGFPCARRSTSSPTGSAPAESSTSCVSCTSAWIPIDTSDAPGVRAGSSASTLNHDARLVLRRYQVTIVDDDVWIDLLGA